MPTTLTPEEADRIATEHYAPVLRRMAPGYCVARVAELLMALTMAGYPTDAAQAGALLPRRGENR